MSLQNQSKPSDFLTVPALGFIAFGVYLLAGSYYGLMYAKWPFFMPPQLDVIGLLLGVLGAQTAAYVGGALLGMLGLALAFAGICVLVKRDA